MNTMNRGNTVSSKPITFTAHPDPLSREEARRLGRLILVAEDNEINQKVILQQINLLGFTADLTGDGLQALNRWHTGDYALILVDLHMPVMDGYQLAAAVRAQEPPGRRIPIVALTANVLKSEAARCRVVGMDDYLSKPTPLAVLQIMLKRWLHISPAGNISSQGYNKPLVFPPYDLGVLRKQIGNDPHIISELLQDFRASVAQSVDEIGQYCATGNAVAAAAIAHKLKSAALSIGAFSLGELCTQMEDVGITHEVDLLPALHTQLKLEQTNIENHFRLSDCHVEPELCP